MSPHRASPTLAARRTSLSETHMSTFTTQAPSQEYHRASNATTGFEIQRYQPQAQTQTAQPVTYSQHNTPDLSHLELVFIQLKELGFTDPFEIKHVSASPTVSAHFATPVIATPVLAHHSLPATVRQVSSPATVHQASPVTVHQAPSPIAVQQDVARSSLVSVHSAHLEPGTPVLPPTGDIPQTPSTELVRASSVNTTTASRPDNNIPGVSFSEPTNTLTVTLPNATPAFGSTNNTPGASFSASTNTLTLTLPNNTTTSTMPPNFYIAVQPAATGAAGPAPQVYTIGPNGNLVPVPAGTAPPASAAAVVFQMAPPAAPAPPAMVLALQPPAPPPPAPVLTLALAAPAPPPPPPMIAIQMPAPAPPPPPTIAIQMAPAAPPPPPTIAFQMAPPAPAAPPPMAVTYVNAPAAAGDSAVRFVS